MHWHHSNQKWLMVDEGTPDLGRTSSDLWWNSLMPVTNWSEFTKNLMLCTLLFTWYSDASNISVIWVITVWYFPDLPPSLAILKWAECKAKTPPPPLKQLFYPRLPHTQVLGIQEVTSGMRERIGQTKHFSKVVFSKISAFWSEKLLNLNKRIALHYGFGGVILWKK